MRGKVTNENAMDDIVSMIIDMGENEVKELELPPSDLSDVIYTICCDIKHSVYLELKKKRNN